MPILRKQYDFIAHSEPYSPEDKIYSIGDKIVFQIYNMCNKKWDTKEGIVCFEEYDDDEQYKTGMHLGVFIKYDETKITLPDFLRSMETPLNGTIHIIEQ